MRLLPLALLTAFLAGCAHGPAPLPALATLPGGRTVDAGNAVDVQNPEAAATPGPKVGIAKFSITIPKAVADFVSPGTKSIRIVLTTVGGWAASKPVPSGTFNTVAGAHGCTRAAPITCTMSLSVPAGKDGFTATLYNKTNGKGVSLGVATVIGTIRNKATTTLTMVPNGVPATVEIAPDALVPLNDGAQHSLKVTVSALDASGATIIGPGTYTEPIDLSINNDPNNALYMPTTEVMSPTAPAIVVTYDAAQTLTNGEIIGKAAHAKSGLAFITPLTITPSTLPGLFGGSVSEAQTVTATEYGVTAPYVVTQSGSALSVTCIPTSCAPAAPGSPVRITLTVKAAGNGALQIHDPTGNGLSMPYNATALTLLPGAVSGGDSVGALAYGPDGNMWALLESGALERFTANDAQTTYALPNYSGGTAPQEVAGPDDAMWYVDGLTSAITRFGLGSGDFASTKQFQTSDGGAVMGVTVGSDKALWFTESSGTLGRITTGGTQFSYINATGFGGSTIVAGSDEALWFIDSCRLFRSDTSGNITAFSDLTDKSGQPFAPTTIAPASNGDLWLGSSGGEVCDFQTGGAINSCVQTTLYSLVAMTTGPDGALWAAGYNQTNSVAMDRIASGAGETAEFIVPQTGQPTPYGLSTGPNGTLWLGISNGGIDIFSIATTPAARRPGRWRPRE
jgi:streptogramin lyase